MKKLLFLLSVVFSSLAFTQEKGDADYVFYSLEEAKERPEIVYHLILSKKKLDEIPAEIFEFSNLKILDLSKNKISLIPKDIANLQKLEELNLEKNKVYTIPPQIGALKSLKKLSLSRNDVEELPEGIGGATALEEIDLWSNNVKRIDPAIANLSELEVLDLRGMIISKAMRDSLKVWVPKAKIQYIDGCDCGP